jgi:predicted glycosyltransferase
MKIWIDLDNTPHVPFFKPIIRELEMRGYTVVVTARDAFQVCELATFYGLPFKKVGKHYGKSSLLKILGLCWRSLQLLPLVLREKPALALSHGSRSQIFLCNLLRIPTVMIMDYEHARTPLLLQPRWEIVPLALRGEKLQCKSAERVLTYEGIKEDVYAPEFEPDPNIVQQLNLNDDSIVVTVRPPANEAHYHNPESDTLFVEFMQRVCSTPGIRAILLPRNKLQEMDIRQTWPQWFKDSKVIIPDQAVNGLNLLWHSDLVVSGGGTMNREAAALGIPVYSIFRGKSGAVDRQLQKEGRFLMIENIDAVNNKILLRRRNKNEVQAGLYPSKALDMIIEHIGSIMVKEHASRT